jgi:hypothetical protein
VVVLFLGLELGSWAEWSGAIASFLAVVVALFLPYFSNKTRVKVRTKSGYSVHENPNDVKLYGITINVYNKGGNPVLIKDVGFLIKGKKHISFPNHTNLYLNPKDVHEEGILFDQLKETALKYMGDHKKYKFQPYILDGNDKYFKGKRFKIYKSTFLDNRLFK